ncbi:MAG: TraG family conjugative transposon ATPase [Cyclobacteriaceae bacterium]
MAEIKELLNHNFLDPSQVLIEDLYSGFIFEDNLIIDPSGAITAGIAISPLEKEQYTDADFEQLNSSLAAIVKTLPPGTYIHKQTIFAFPKESTVTFVEKEGYFARNIRRHLSDRQVLKSAMYLYITFTAYEGEKNALNTLISRLKVQISYALQKSPLENNLTSRKRTVIESVNTILEKLKSIKGLKVKPLLLDQLRLRLSEYYSLDPFKNKVAFETEMKVEGSVLLNGLNNVSIVRLNQPGDIISTHKSGRRGLNGFMTENLGADLGIPHIVNEVIRIENTDKILTGFKMMANLIKSFGTVASTSNIEALKQNERFAERAVSTDMPIVSLYHNIIIWADSLGELKDRANQTINAYEQTNGSSAVIETIDVWNWFFAMAPGCAQNSINGLKMLANEALCHFDWSLETISENDGIIVSNRSGQLVHLNLWADWLNSKNAMVIGPTGSGKSFFTNNWISQWYEQGFDIVILDVGGSYKAIVELLGGKYMDYDPKNPISFNPFLLPTNEVGDRILTDEKRVFLIRLLTVLWKDASVGESLSRVAEAIMSEFLDQYITYHNDTCRELPPRLVQFYNWLKDHASERNDLNRDSFDINGFLRVLKRYCEGEYKDMLNSQDTFDISQYRIVCFDLAAINNIPTLRPIVGLLIIEMVMDKLRNNLDVRKGIFMDEAWSFLGGSPELATFMELLFRTCRKQNAASVCITQSVLEFSNSVVGKAIANNTPIKVILDHAGKSEQFSELQSFLGFTDLDIDKIRSISKDAVSREFFLKREDYSQVYKLDAGPVSSTAFSSSPKDRFRMKELMKKYRSVEFAINQMVEEQSL